MSAVLQVLLQVTALKSFQIALAMMLISQSCIRNVTCTTFLVPELSEISCLQRNVYYVIGSSADLELLCNNLNSVNIEKPLQICFSFEFTEMVSVLEKLLEESKGNSPNSLHNNNLSDALILNQERSSSSAPKIKSNIRIDEIKLFFEEISFGKKSHVPNNPSSFSKCNFKDILITEIIKNFKGLNSENDDTDHISDFFCKLEEKAKTCCNSEEQFLSALNALKHICIKYPQYFQEIINYNKNATKCDIEFFLGSLVSTKFFTKLLTEKIIEKFSVSTKFSLSLSGHIVNGEIPAVSMLSNITELHLYGSRFDYSTEYPIQSIIALSNLKSVTLDNAYLARELLNFLGKQSKQSNFSPGQVSIGAQQSNCFHHIEWEYLKINCNSFSSDDVKLIANLSKLNSLRVIIIEVVESNYVDIFKALRIFENLNYISKIELFSFNELPMLPIIISKETGQSAHEFCSQFCIEYQIEMKIYKLKRERKKLNQYSDDDFKSNLSKMKKNDIKKLKSWLSELKQDSVSTRKKWLCV